MMELMNIPAVTRLKDFSNVGNVVLSTPTHSAQPMT